ncbi:putative membrane protein [Vibrio crassostreae]|uniref:PACE efflux transporter n=1 Tax=Vibrio crassostreae TaxID=246167 RepID=UPI000F462A9B|nr:PACE efflux transporter [Vibrio crassostreae]ROR27770.1 putative membrane protein [Vibrio crassostreae]TCV31249.1 putative membrane protein [Vibrio crassostreae]TWD32117.1 putative membrane protein [Vibrio crassostreae]CAK3089864.1 putative Short-chain diamines transporter [Vibrio crassostreae]CAK3595615.1 putative Short-chain diamines transporter [Vibrio crassostreae]
MSTIERVFHSVLFEVLAVTLSIIGLAIFTEHDVNALSGTMIVVATIAMIWNYCFNRIFDRYFTGEKSQRSLKLRIFHVVLFEAGLLIATIPVMAFLLNVGIWQAFLMDIGVTIFITIYAFVFNLIYDHVRALWVRRADLAVQ